MIEGFTITDPEPCMDGTLYLGAWEVTVCEASSEWECSFYVASLRYLEMNRAELLDEGAARIKEARNRLH